MSRFPAKSVGFGSRKCMNLLLKKATGYSVTLLS